jgi:hypothetical protein
MSMKNSNDSIGNRSRDLPVCSTVPQPLCHHVPHILTVPSPNVLAADVFGMLLFTDIQRCSKHQTRTLWPLSLDPFITSSHASFNLPEPRYLLHRSLVESQSQSGRLTRHTYILRLPEKKPAAETLYWLRYSVCLLHQRITKDLQTKCGNLEPPWWPCYSQSQVQDKNTNELAISSLVSHLQPLNSTNFIIITWCNLVYTWWQ